jgi:DNA repair protein RadC
LRFGSASFRTSHQLRPASWERSKINGLTQTLFTMTRQIIFPSEVAEITLSYNCILPRNCATIHCSNDAVEVFRCRWDAGKINFVEEFKILLMNRANRVLGIVNISQGGVSGTVADPKLIFAAALKASASCIIAAHNHPSGNLTPSQADIQLTAKLKEAGKFLDLPVLDHVIITQDGYYSFADEGLL